MVHIQPLSSLTVAYRLSFNLVSFTQSMLFNPVIHRKTADHITCDYKQLHSNFFKQSLMHKSKSNNKEKRFHVHTERGNEYLE